MARSPSYGLAAGGWWQLRRPFDGGSCHSRWAVSGACSNQPNANRSWLAPRPGTLVGLADYLFSCTGGHIGSFVTLISRGPLHGAAPAGEIRRRNRETNDR